MTVCLALSDTVNADNYELKDDGTLFINGVTDIKRDAYWLSKVKRVVYGDGAGNLWGREALSNCALESIRSCFEFIQGVCLRTLFRAM